jgi:hypothetical protein
MKFYWKTVIESKKKAQKVPWSTLKQYEPTYQKTPKKFKTLPIRNGKQS